MRFVPLALLFVAAVGCTSGMNARKQFGILNSDDEKQSPDSGSRPVRLATDDTLTEPLKQTPADRDIASSSVVPDQGQPSQVVQASAEMPQGLSVSAQALFRRAQQGDANAQYSLGYMYQFGKGVP